MDLYCVRCGEPWDFDTLHEEAELRYENEYGVEHRTTYQRDSDLAERRYRPIFDQIAKDFRTLGCQALKEFRGTDAPCEGAPSIRAGDRAAVASALYDLLGDDMDGAAALLDDFESGR